MQRARALGVGALLVGWVAAAEAAAQTLPLAGPTPVKGHLELALHARSTRATERAEQAGWVTLTVPLDRLAAPRVALASPPPAPALDGVTPPSSLPALLTSTTPDPPQELGLQQLAALAEFTRSAVSVAVTLAGVASERARLDALAARARASALLPELRLRALRNTDQALRWVPTTDDPYRVSQAGGAGLVLEASMTFRLDRLVFASEELTVERLRQQAGEERLKLEARVQQALLALLRARQMACALDRADPARVSHELELLEQIALLDSLTGGWFLRRAPELGRAVWGFPQAISGECEPPEPPGPPPKPATTNPVASATDSE